jgi:hypothetical protein
MQSYEEKVTEILATLKGAQTVETEVPATFWRQKYEQDIQFLLKELANSRGRTRDLNQRLVAAAELATANVAQIQDLRARMGKAIDLLTTPEKK